MAVAATSFLAGILVMALLVVASEGDEAQERIRAKVDAEWHARDARAAALSDSMPPLPADKPDHSLDIWPWYDPNWPAKPTTSQPSEQ